MVIGDASSLDGLCPPLRLFLDAELAAGNRIVRLEGGWSDQSELVVLLAEPFRTRFKAVDADVLFREVSIPGMWKAQFMHIPSRQVLACGFGDA